MEIIASEVTTKICHYCLTRQAEVNHWWAIWIVDGIFHLADLEHAPPMKGMKYACGQNCEAKLRQRWMDTRSLDVVMFDEPEERPVGLKVVAGQICVPGTDNSERKEA